MPRPNQRRNPSQRRKPPCHELLLSSKQGHFSQSCLLPLLPSSGKARKSRTPCREHWLRELLSQGVVDKASYRKLVADLYFVYSAMEEEIGKLTDHPVVAPVAMAQLNCREALEQDPPITSATAGRKKLSLSSAAAYVERIHAVAQESPEFLVGHHYTRYLGDLSGGQT